MKTIIISLFILNIGLSLAHAIRNKSIKDGWVPSILGWACATLIAIMYIP